MSSSATFCISLWWTTLEIEVCDAQFFCCQVFFLLLLPILSKIPIICRVTLFLLIFKPLRIVLELPQLINITSKKNIQCTYQVPSTHTWILTRRILNLLCLVKYFLFSLFLVHPRLFPYCERFRCNRCQVTTKLVPLDLQKFFYWDSVSLGCFIDCLLLRFEYESWRKCVSVLTSIAVWTFPEPSKLLRLDSFNKEFANNLYDEVRLRTE